MFKSKLLKSFVLAIAVLCCNSNLFAKEVEYIHPFKLNAVNDGLLLGTSTLLAGSALICGKVIDFKNVEFDQSALDKADISMFEQFLMTSYNKPVDYISYGTMAFSLLSPAIFAAVPSNEWLGIGVMYAEALMLSYGTKEWMKNLISRPRPYMYTDNYPSSDVTDGDWNCSFPSGHTIAAFTAASFTSYVYNQYFPDSDWKYLVTGVSFGLAGLTGAFRIASGSHFFTDVLVSAVIGTIYGFAVPYMHTEVYYKKFNKSKGTSISASPLGLNVQVKF